MSKSVSFFARHSLALTRTIVDSVTSGARSAIPDWLAKRSKKSLKHDLEYRSRIELIQDFEFPEASLKVKFTRDRKHIMATGVYKPQIRVFDLAELSMKFDRHTECENVAFEILTDDWTKSVHLQADRSVEFHSQYGMHYKTRIPKFGRDLAYYHPTCDMFFCGSSQEIYRLNLDQGRFLNPFMTAGPAHNTIRINSAHGLIGVGGEDGNIEFWHPTQRRNLARLDVAKTLSSRAEDTFEKFPEITALEFHSDGLSFACGTATGHVLLYDLRMSQPLLVKDHQYGLPIKSLSFHPTGNVVSADSKVVRLWNKNDGTLFTAIEPPHDINDVCIPDDSGLVVVANEGVQVQTYYVPQLGPAPKWCPFLDNLTEELEENPNGITLYDDYKFVTRKELSRLALDHLVGTNVLKAYMHGYFLDLRLYNKAKAIANPFEYEEFKKRRITEKLEKDRKTRIHATRKLPKVNAGFALRLMKETGELAGSDEDEDEKRNNKRKKKDAGLGAIKTDDRFKGLFEDEDYQIDENSSEWKLHHPSEVRNKTSLTLANFTKVDDGRPDRSSDESDRSDQDSDDNDDLNSEDEEAISKFKFDPRKPTVKPVPFHKLKLEQNSRGNEPKNKGPAMYELKDGQRSTELSLASRLKQTETEGMSGYGRGVLNVSGGRAGAKSMTFHPSRIIREPRLRAGEERDQGEERKRRRGIRELGLRPVGGAGRGRGRGGSRGGRGGAARGSRR
ncbi:Nucleolar protein 10 [Entophlyctis luteolus]|nr:Nucleolar protein 10 [Entophlyctis luteolus]